MVIPALVLVRNKVDLSAMDRIFQRAKESTLTDQWMCPFYVTSANNSINVDQVIT
jgi:hypothetical protein